MKGMLGGHRGGVSCWIDLLCQRPSSDGGVSRLHPHAGTERFWVVVGGGRKRGCIGGKVEGKLVELLAFRFDAGASLRSRRCTVEQ